MNIRNQRTRVSPPGDIADRLIGRRRVAARVAIVVLALLASASGAELAAQVDPFSLLRRTMVDQQVRKRGIEEPGLLSAMETVPRHLFVLESKQPQAYDDTPVAYAPGQKIPHAYVSARMISQLELDGDERVLEIGTGSGYEAALLSRMAREVCTVEIDRTLGNRARRTLRRLGFDNVEVKIGDGYRGWPEKAPFDAILVTVSAQRLPEPLIEQLKVGGKMVMAVGRGVYAQEMLVLTKTEDGREMRRISLVNLEPMTGEVTQQD